MTDAGTDQRWELILYVAGMTPDSRRAQQNIERICEQHLTGAYTLETVDLYEQPGRAEQDQIVALPTLVRRLPPPLRKIIGDLSNTDQVLRGLALTPEAGSGSESRDRKP